MNWFDHILGSLDQPRIMVEHTMLEPFSCLSYDQIVIDHGLEVGTKAWVSYRLRDGLFGLMFAHIESPSTMRVTPYRSGYPSALHVEDYDHPKLRVECNFMDHGFIRKIIVKISDGKLFWSSVFFNHKSPLIRYQGIVLLDDYNVDVLDTKFFRNDIDRMAALQYLNASKNRNSSAMNSFREILKGTSY